MVHEGFWSLECCASGSCGFEASLVRAFDLPALLLLGLNKASTWQATAVKQLLLCPGKLCEANVFDSLKSCIFPEPETAETQEVSPGA